MLPRMSPACSAAAAGGVVVVVHGGSVIGGVAPVHLETI